MSANCYYVNNTGSCSDATERHAERSRGARLPGSVSYRRIEIVGGGADYAITASEVDCGGREREQPVRHYGDSRRVPQSLSCRRRSRAAAKPVGRRVQSSPRLLRRES